MAATRGQWLLRNPSLTLGLRRTDRPAIELALELDETWSCKTSGRERAPGLEVRCLSGAVWVTLEGDVEDHVLSEGDSFVAARPGRVAVMALRPARLRVTGCAGARLADPRVERPPSSTAS